MKAVLEDVKLHNGRHSYVAYSFSVPAFEFKWHYHPEYELTLILNGTGSRIIGDSQLPFQKNDLVLVGSGLPHTWYTNAAITQECTAVVIQFSERFLQPFLSLSEFGPIAKLLDDASRGIYFKQDKAIIDEITSLPGATSMFRITKLLNILQLLANKKRNYLSQKAFTILQSTKTQNRINEVCQFVHEHANENITVDQVAQKVYLSKSAFCKFFKRVMKVTFSDYVNDIRIANACRLLSSSDLTIKEIALETGFESLTYFNRVFSKKKECTPSEFRKNKSLTHPTRRFPDAAATTFVAQQ